MKKVIITGVLGMDGSLMAEFLINKGGYEIYGVSKRYSNSNKVNIRKLENQENFNLVYGDITDPTSINSLVKRIQPDYFFNFAANSFVGCSWEMPSQVSEVNADGVLNCLESLRQFKKDCFFYSAGSSEQFGNVEYSPQDIKHPFKPRSPYGVSKCTAQNWVKIYRESYGMNAVQGILFNHEHERRGEEFVTTKIAKGVAKIYEELLKSKETGKLSITPIYLGNLDAKRDWSYAEDFVDGIWRMANQDSFGLEFGGKDCLTEYILSSGETHSVREFIELAFSFIGVRLKNVNNVNHRQPKEGESAIVEYCLDFENKVDSNEDAVPVVLIDSKFYRPAEVNLLLGDSTPVREKLDWEPKVSFAELVQKMVVRHVNNDIGGFLKQ